MTQSELGEGLVTPSMISQIEADKANPSHKLLMALADRLGAPVEFFLSDMQTRVEQTNTYRTAKSMIPESPSDAALMLEELLVKRAAHLDSTEVELDLANCYLQMKRLDRAAELYEDVLVAAIKSSRYALMIDCYNKLGVVYFRQGLSELARHYWYKAERMVKQHPDTGELLAAQVYINLGIVSSRVGDYSKALNYYAMASELLQGSTDMEKIGDVYHGLGQVYKQLGNYRLAAEYTQDAITMLKSLHRLKQSYDVRLNLGKIRVAEGKFDDAIELFQDCLEGYTLHGDAEDIANVHCEMARLAIRRERYGDVQALCDTALREIHPESLVAADCCLVLAEAFHRLGREDDAYEAVHKATELFQKYGRMDEIRQCRRLLADIFVSKGEKDKAYQMIREAYFDGDAAISH